MSKLLKKSENNFKIILGHREIEVLPLERREADAHEAKGLYFPNYNKIRVDITKDTSDVAEILLHEVLHAIWEQMCLKEENVNEEEVISALSKGICLLIKQNPKFFNLLQNAILNNKRIKI